MNENINTIEKFYTAFASKNTEGMNSCYGADIVFSDPAFGLLQGQEVHYMWKMLCSRATDLQIEYSQITTDDNEYYTCNWKATYTFTKTGRKVVNKIKAYMRLQNGIIIEHSDAFNFYNWAKQAFGWKGYALGWTNFFNRKVQKICRKSLVAFIEKNN
jgi:ketosteroid isomerase-like protein